MTILEALTWSKKLLAEAGAENPTASAEFLLSHALDKPKEYLFSHSDEDLAVEDLTIFQDWTNRRAKHEPVWYITGKIKFMSLELVVDKNVLIPRPETELLVEKIQESVENGFAPKNVLEIGTGSGAIILSLCSSLRDDAAISFFASDISEGALKVAQANAEFLGSKDLIAFHEGDLFEPWSGQRFDLIVANLPYVPEGDKDSLAADLTSYEPHLALFGGVEGLDIVFRFIDELPGYTNDGCKVFLEIGYDQGDKITKYVSRILPSAITTVFGDYAGVDRIVIIET